METIYECNLCGGREQTAIEMYRRYNTSFHMVKCVQCGLVFLNPRPTVDEMSAYYNEDYHASHFSADGGSRLVTFAFSLCRVWLKARYSEGSASVARCVWPVEAFWRRVRHKYVLYGLSVVGRVLDVGCGDGAWLARMKQLGFECYGCEPDAIRSGIAASIPGLTISRSDLHAAGYSSDYFDVVRIWHALEHVHDPMAVLHEIKRVLKPGGLLVLGSPNCDSILARAYSQLEDVPRHLYVFSPRTIGMYLRNAGLETHYLRTESQPSNIYGRFHQEANAFLEETGRTDALRSNAKFWTSWRRSIEYRASQRHFDSIGAVDSLCLSAIKS